MIIYLTRYQDTYANFLTSKLTINCMCMHINVHAEQFETNTHTRFVAINVADSRSLIRLTCTDF